MLDIKHIRENPDKIKESLAKKNISSDSVDAVLDADGKRRALLQKYEELRKKQNEFSESITRHFGAEKEQALSEMKGVKADLSKIEEELKTAEEVFQNWMYKLPNVPFSEVPLGKDESGNKVIREVGEKPDFSFTPRTYIELGEKLDLIDTERAGKVSGSRFGYLKHEAPLLEFALVQFIFSRLINEEFLTRVITASDERNENSNSHFVGAKTQGARVITASDERNENSNSHFVGAKTQGARVIAGTKPSVSSKPFVPLVPPVMIRPEVFRAMGRLDPGQEDERYFLPKDNLYLVGSAEHTTGPMHMEEIFEESALPHRHVAFSTCFRREAGSYGKDTRGILRVHQFDKIELFSFSNPHGSNEEHEFLLGIQEELMKELKIPYRVVFVCTGDMGWPDAKQYDIEAWMPGQKEYRETHSASNTTDFQARRLNIKYRKSADGKTELLHMLNATGIAIGRMLIAIFENYQQKDGSVRVPSMLLPFMHGIHEIKPRK